MSLGHRSTTPNQEVSMPIHHSPIAQPLRGEEMPVLAVYFDLPVPAKFPGEGPGVDVVQPAQAWYRAQADALVLAMERHCPGGFMDALLGSLLTRKASVFVVPTVIVGGTTNGDHP